MSEYRFDEESASSTPAPAPGLEPASVRPLVSTGRRGANHAEPVGETAAHLLDYVKVLYRRRWTAVMAFALVTVCVTGAALV